MTDEQAARLEYKLDTLLEMLPSLQILERLVVQHKDATRALGLNKNTITNNDKIEKFGVPGSNVTLVKLSELAVIRKQKRKRSTVK